MFILFGALCIAFAARAFVRPVSVIFSGLFAAVAYMLFAGIRHKKTSGLTIGTSSLKWFSDSSSETIELSSVVRVEWQRADSEKITLTLSDSSEVHLDQRYFGDGASILSAIKQRARDIDLRQDGRSWPE